MDNINFTAQEACKLAENTLSEEYIKVKRAIYEEALMGHYEKTFESMGHWVKVSLEQEGFDIEFDSSSDDAVKVMW